jgi:hypothetical protein
LNVGLRELRTSLHDRKQTLAHQEIYGTSTSENGRGDSNATAQPDSRRFSALAKDVPESATFAVTARTARLPFHSPMARTRDRSEEDEATRAQSKRVFIDEFFVEEKHRTVVRLAAFRGSKRVLSAPLCVKRFSMCLV